MDNGEVEGEVEGSDNQIRADNGQDRWMNQKKKKRALVCHNCGGK